MPQFFVHELIQRHLTEMETTQNVRVLYAVESGSRAWGFASPDSDWDVRFLYVRPKSWYLSVQKRRDVIEAMMDPDLDFAGWDLPKALGLLAKSNPALIEWLSSPIVYQEDGEFMCRFRELAKHCISLDVCRAHYLHMAMSNWRTYLLHDGPVSLKKYLYVLRPVLACRFIETHHDAPPMLFAELVASVGEPGAVQDEIDRLLQVKAVSSELGVGTRVPPLDEFIERELARFKAVRLQSKHSADYERLDAFFRATLV